MLMIDDCASTAASPPPQYYENLRAPQRAPSRVPTPQVVGTPVRQVSSLPLTLATDVPLQQPAPAHARSAMALVPQRFSYVPGSMAQNPQGLSRPEELSRQHRRACMSFAPEPMHVLTVDHWIARLGCSPFTAFYAFYAFSHFTATNRLDSVPAILHADSATTPVLARFTAGASCDCLGVRGAGPYQVQPTTSMCVYVPRLRMGKLIRSALLTMLLVCESPRVPTPSPPTPRSISRQPHAYLPSPMQREAQIGYTHQHGRTCFLRARADACTHHKPS